LALVGAELAASLAANARPENCHERDALLRAALRDGSERLFTDFFTESA
jgi:hypothetical protein